MPAGSGRYPSGQRGQTVNLLAYAFGGSNPPLPTIVASAARTDSFVGGLSEARVAPMGGLGEVRVAPTRATTVHMAMARATTVRAARACTTAVHTAKDVGVCGNSSAVERQPSKLGVAGSNPVSRSRIGARGVFREAHVAQLVEHALGKGEVSGSIPDMGSSFRRAVVAVVNGR